MGAKNPPGSDLHFSSLADVIKQSKAGESLA